MPSAGSIVEILGAVSGFFAAFAFDALLRDGKVTGLPPWSPGFRGP
jgi:hypothetical protein